MYRYEVIIYWSTEDAPLSLRFLSFQVVWPTETLMRPHCRALRRPLASGLTRPMSLVTGFPNQRGGGFQLQPAL